MVRKTTFGVQMEDVCGRIRELVSEGGDEMRLNKPTNHIRVDSMFQASHEASYASG